MGHNSRRLFGYPTPFSQRWMQGRFLPCNASEKNDLSLLAQNANTPATCDEILSMARRHAVAPFDSYMLLFPVILCGESTY